MAMQLSNRTHRRLGQRQIIVPPSGGNSEPLTLEIDPENLAGEETAPVSSAPADAATTNPATPPAGTPESQPKSRREEILDHLNALQSAIQQVAKSVYGVEISSESLIDCSTKAVESIGDSVADQTSQVVETMLGIPQPKRSGMRLSARKVNAAYSQHEFAAYLTSAKIFLSNEAIVEANGGPVESFVQLMEQTKPYLPNMSPEDFQLMWHDIAAKLVEEGKLPADWEGAGQLATIGGPSEQQAAAPVKLKGPPASEMGDEKLMVPASQVDAEVTNHEVSADWIIDQYEKAKRIHDDAKREQRLTQLRDIARTYKELGEGIRRGRLR